MCDSAQFNLFADDTTLEFGDHDYGRLDRKANGGLALVFEWTLNNRFSLNSNKTSILLLANRASASVSP